MDKFKSGDRVIYHNILSENSHFEIVQSAIYHPTGDENYYDLFSCPYDGELYNWVPESLLTLDISYYRNKKLKELGI